jgi:hypothetical protein
LEQANKLAEQYSNIAERALAKIPDYEVTTHLMRGYGITWQYKKRQIIISTIAYILWVAALGTFQDAIPVPAAIVTIVLGIFTLGAPLIDPGTNTSTRQSATGAERSSDATAPAT